MAKFFAGHFIRAIVEVVMGIKTFGGYGGAEIFLYVIILLLSSYQLNFLYPLGYFGTDTTSIEVI